jgi:RIO kinase 1
MMLPGPFFFDLGIRVMPRININQNIDEDFEFVDESSTSYTTKQGRTIARITENQSQHAVLDDLLSHQEANVGAEGVFSPTFSASRYEREWFFRYLGPFYDEAQITDVLFRIKGGKEATVYCCTGPVAEGTGLLAAKIYRPRMFRNLRNDVRYRQNRRVLNDFGKEVRDDRLVRAIHKGTDIGKEALQVSWLQHEYHALQVLFDAGVKVPRPIATGSNTILMEYFGDREMSAPTLQEVHLSKEEAQKTFKALMIDIDTMLGCGYVHGDLSAYNVLYFDGDYRIIDLPQAVSPNQNPDARDIFFRDVTRLAQYFKRYGIDACPEEIARGMWRKYRYRDDPLSDRKESIKLMQEIEE